MRVDTVSVESGHLITHGDQFGECDLVAKNINVRGTVGSQKIDVGSISLEGEGELCVSEHIKYKTLTMYGGKLMIHGYYTEKAVKMLITDREGFEDVYVFNDSIQYCIWCHKKGRTKSIPVQCLQKIRGYLKSKRATRVKNTPSPCGVYAKNPMQTKKEKDIILLFYNSLRKDGDSNNGHLKKSNAER